MIYQITALQELITKDIAISNEWKYLRKRDLGFWESSRYSILTRKDLDVFSSPAANPVVIAPDSK